MIASAYTPESLGPSTIASLFPRTIPVNSSTVTVGENTTRIRAVARAPGSSVVAVRYCGASTLGVD
jgi:hypothetical protein